MCKLLWSVFFIVLMLSGCGFDGTPTRHNDFTPLTSIEIVAVSPSIAAHTSTPLSVIGNFSGLYTRDITDQAVWSSDTPIVADFATASNPNRVTGHVPGSAILTATVGSVPPATLSFTVSPATITAMTITPAAPSIPKGMNTQCTVRGTFSDTSTQDLTFDANWASSASVVASVSDAASSKGFAKALGVGTSTITATFDGISGTTLLTVTEVVLQSIAVSTANPSILSLSSASFKAIGYYSDGTTGDITSLAAWTSSRPDIATIAASGAATTLLQGTTSISATLGGISGTANLKVTGGNLTDIVISPANPFLVKNTLTRITATGSFSNGTSRDITGVVVWSTANTAIATVTGVSGNLVWLNALAVTPASTPTTVTAKSGTRSATANLTVTAPVLQSLSITPASLNLTVGTSDRFAVTANFSDGTAQDVTANATWKSSNVTKATIGDSGIAKGRVSGVAAGTTTISATYGGTSVTATPVTVAVTTRTLQSLTILGSTTVPSGNQVNLTATANYFDGSNKDVTEDTAWTIDNPNVAILADSTNQPGQVVGVDSGSATLTITFGGKSQTTTVRVP